MATNKSIETQNGVAGFLTTITDEEKCKDCSTRIALFPSIKFIL
jgi:hypothetical protein